jgi:hypothetical protein
MAFIVDQGLPFLLMKRLGSTVAENGQSYILPVGLASPYLPEHLCRPVGELNLSGGCFRSSGQKLAGFWQ